MIAKMYSGRFYDYIALAHFEPGVGWFGQRITHNGDVRSYLIWKPNIEVMRHNCWQSVPCIHALSLYQRIGMFELEKIHQGCVHYEGKCTSPI